MKKYTMWSLRWPTPLHEIAVKIARDNKRSLNEQILVWLETGSMLSDIERGRINIELDEIKERYIELINEASKSVPGIRDMKLREAEALRERLAFMGVDEVLP